MQKKGQLNISFGMIFAVILIIAFLVFGFFVIQKFLTMQKGIQVNQFVDSFSQDINKAYSSQQASSVVTYSLPSDIASVCFIYQPTTNMQINYKKAAVPKEVNIDHLDIEKTLDGKKDSICKNVTDGKISFRLVKEYSAPLVTVKV